MDGNPKAQGPQKPVLTDKELDYLFRSAGAMVHAGERTITQEEDTAQLLGMVKDEGFSTIAEVETALRGKQPFHIHLPQTDPQALQEMTALARTLYTPEDGKLSKKELLERLEKAQGDALQHGDDNKVSGYEMLKQLLEAPKNLEGLRPKKPKHKTREATWETMMPGSDKGYYSALLIKEAIWDIPLPEAAQKLLNDKVRYIFGEKLDGVTTFGALLSLEKDGYSKELPEDQRKLFYKTVRGIADDLDIKRLHKLYLEKAFPSTPQEIVSSGDFERFFPKWAAHEGVADRRGATENHLLNADRLFDATMKHLEDNDHYNRHRRMTPEPEQSARREPESWLTRLVDHLGSNTEERKR